MKKLLKVIVSLVLILAVIGGAFFALSRWEPYALWSIKRNPAAQLQRSFQKTAAAISSGSMFKIPDSVAKAGAEGAIGLDLTTLDNTTMQNMIYLRNSGITVTGSTKMPEEDAAMDYGLWLTENAFVINAPSTEDSNSYGLQFSTLKEDLKDSALLTYMGVSYEEACEYIDSVFGKEQKDSAEEDSQKNEMQMMLQLAELLEKCPYIVEEGTLNIENKTVGAYHIAYTVSPTLMQEALDLLISWSEPAEGEEAADGSEAAAETQSMREAAVEWKKAIVESNATAMVDFYLHNKTQMIMQASFRLDWMQDDKAGTITANISLGENPAQSLCYSASVSTTYPGMTKETITAEYHRTNAHNLPGRKLILTQKGESVTLMDLQLNEVTNTFELGIIDRTYTLSGTCKQEEGKLIIQTDIADVGTMTLTFHENADAPTVPKYTNLCYLSEAELEALLGSMTPEYPDDEWDDDWDDEWSDNAVSLVVEDSEGSMYFMYYSGNYDSVGDLMVAEEVAVLDENGRVVSVYAFDEQLPGDAWLIIVGEDLYEGSLYDIPLSGEISISLIGSAAEGK